MDIRWNHADVCAAMREYMERRGMAPPDEDAGFVLLPQEGGAFAIEVKGVALPARAATPTPSPSPRAAVGTPPAIPAEDEPPPMEVPAGLDLRDFPDQLTVDEPASDFGDEADERNIQLLFNQAGLPPPNLAPPATVHPSRARQRHPGRPGYERHSTIERFDRIPTADGDISGEI